MERDIEFEVTQDDRDAAEALIIELHDEAGWKSDSDMYALRNRIGMGWEDGHVYVEAFARYRTKLAEEARNDDGRIKSCKCGRSEPHHRRFNNHGVLPANQKWSRITCHGCGVHSRDMRTKAEAIDDWNRQVDDMGTSWFAMRTAPRDGSWFLAQSTSPGWKAVRIVRFANKDDRMPIGHEPSGVSWPSVPTGWRPIDISGLRQFFRNEVAQWLYDDFLPTFENGGEDTAFAIEIGLIVDELRKTESTDHAD